MITAEAPQDSPAEFLYRSSNMPWTDVRVDLLKKLWADGLSASQIACQLGDATRNAVIGKVHRLGLSGRARTSRFRPTKSRTRHHAARRRMKPRFPSLGNPAFRALLAEQLETPPAEELFIPLSERKQITTLAMHMCRWPIGDPLHDDFHFCGRTRVSGLPYCDFHGRRAFQVSAPRNRPALPAPTSRLMIEGPRS